MYENKAALSHVCDLPLLTVAAVSSRMTRGERFGEERTDQDAVISVCDGASGPPSSISQHLRILHKDYCTMYLVCIWEEKTTTVSQNLLRLKKSSACNSIWK